jgi:hypothetical protein
VIIQLARYQQTLRRYHDKLVQHEAIAVGDLVLRRIQSGEGRHKLSPPWEGAFMIAEVTLPGSYRLTQMDGTPVGKSWNIEHLRKLYHSSTINSRWWATLCKLVTSLLIKLL